MRLPLIAVLVLCAARLSAAITSDTLEYDADGTTCSGTLAFDDSWTTPHPAILVAHDWMGNTENSQGHARDLVKLGYVALAVDVYGKGVRPADAGEAGKLAGTYKGDRRLMRSRMAAGLKALLATGKADPKKIGATGYCFGGTCVLELARSGAPLLGVVTFHGGLATPTPEDAKNITGKVLVLHGADDPFVKPEEVAAFEAEMRAAKVDWQVVLYSKAVHSFTNTKVGSDPSKGQAYNPEADRRSWLAMTDFFTEVFAAP